MENSDTATNNGHATYRTSEEVYPMQPPVPAIIPPLTGTTPPRVEITHVLFMDIVGYSLLDFSQQGEVQLELQRIVQQTETVRRARAENNVILRPTGDGMAILFLKDLLSPIRCALEVDESLKAEQVSSRNRSKNRLRLRMGIHTGPVLMVEDINLQSDVAGEGIIMAQRVMDCGDAGHILLSEEFARALIKIDPWPRYLNDIGICWVKHGIPVHLYNLYGRRNGARGAHTFGNGNRPQKIVTGAYQPGDMAAPSRFPFPVRRIVTPLIVLLVMGIVGFGLSKVPRTTYNALGKQITVLAARLTPSPTKSKSKNDKKKNSSTSKGKEDTAPKSNSNGDKSSGSAENGDSDTAENTNGKSKHKSTTLLSVPDLTSVTYEDAQLILAQTGLSLRRSDKSDYNTSVEKGTIYQQEPPPGKRCPPGTKVYVRVSKGDPPDHTDEGINADGTVKEGGAPL